MKNFKITKQIIFLAIGITNNFNRANPIFNKFCRFYSLDLTSTNTSNLIYNYQRFR